MSIVQPNPTDTLGSVDHAHLHRVFGSDSVAPSQSVVVDSSGNVLMLIGNINISHQLVSNTNSGLAPFVVSSNTVITNLNADLLDGFNGSYYSTAGNLTGTIPSTVLSNSNTFIGTTSVSLNRPSSNLTLSGISLSGISASFSANTASSNTSTGSVIVTGGVGMSGDLNVGGNIYSIGSLKVNSSTASSNTSTGSIIVTGGVGISGNLNVGGSFTAAGTNFTSNVVVSASSATSNTSTGALVVLGGIGVGGDIYSGGQIFETSDIRLKSDIIRISDPLEKVLNLNGYTFDKNGRKSTGLIAQEVIEIIPEAVSTDDKYLAVSYGNLVGLLIEAIKEQNERIVKLENIINQK